MLQPTAAVLAACLLGSMPAQTPGRPPGPGKHAAIRLHFATFDPLLAEPAVPAALRSTAPQMLWIVQFAGIPTQAGRDAITRSGGKLLGYLPDQAYVVRMQAAAAQQLRDSETVRWVGRYHPAYRLAPDLLHERRYDDSAAVRYNLVVADKHTDKPALITRLHAIGARVDDEHFGSLLLAATLTGAQLLEAAGFDEVLWIDRCTPVELDMDNARIQGGANYIETQAGYTGSGVRAHVYEGIEATHPDFTGTVTNVLSGGAATAHGQATAGILFGNGTSNPIVRGMAPDCGKYYTDFATATASRWQVFDALVSVHGVSHTTASWGNPNTWLYTSISAEADDIVFDHDLAWTQSQGNRSSSGSRPQAWAKNVFSIGGVWHGDDSNPGNDSWLLGGASSGPASDGRIKPTLVAYTDMVGTSDLTGAAGFTPMDWNANFGGTSASTPIVGGHNVLAIQMFTDDSATPGFGLFGNRLRMPGGTAHQNRPHFPTLKALMVASASQYPFTAASTDNRREHVGWGFPDLRQLYDRRNRTFVVDETDVLSPGQIRSWQVDVAAGEPALKVCLNWSEPPAIPAAASSLVNNLSLRVTAPGGAQVYWGNQGLNSGVWSTPGGSEDAINSIECVFVQNPTPGPWTIEVLATSIVQDNHLQTAAVDADYGLVVTGVTVSLATAVAVGAGCNGVTLAATPRPVIGATVRLDTTNAPAGTLLGVQILSASQLNPPLALATLGMPGCELYQPLDLLVQFATSGASGSLSLPVPNDPSLAGAAVYTQSATLTPGINPFGFATSNGLALTIGIY